jgi:hypothetical protein
VSGNRVGLLGKRYAPEGIAHDVGFELASDAFK